MDHCDELYSVFKKGKIGEFYNIGSNKNLNNIEICRTLLQIAKKKIVIQKKTKIEFIKDRPGHDIRYALDSTKIKKTLKWKPKRSFKIGLEETLDWYLKNDKYYKSFKKKDIVNRLGTRK
jgi:dTDP-glucose 4,6-dehydratase